MLFCALASDYDGTIASDGRVDAATVQALERFKATGKRLILVTGRQLDDLRAAFDPLSLFDAVVAENGATLYLPLTRERRRLAAAPPDGFIEALHAKGVDPLAVGDSIVATWIPNEHSVLAAIRELGLDWQMTFNKGAVMCLPPGVNKASGLSIALDELKLSAHNVVGIGDAENDQSFLSACGCSVAVANAIEVVKQHADLCMSMARGAGVAELIDRWLDDAAGAFATVRRHDVELGDALHGDGTLTLPSDRGAVLIAGASGIGKTSLAHLLVERILAGRYQLCIVDPEGDYSGLAQVTHLGSADRTPSPAEVMSVLESPAASVAVNLLGLEVSDRAAFFGNLLGRISGLRTAAGRPHWLILDEAHHLFPNTQESEHTALPDNLSATLFVTTRPQGLSQAALRSIRTVLAVGPEAQEVISQFCRSVGEPPPAPCAEALPPDALLYFNRDAPGQTVPVSVGQARHRHLRHTRKYAEGRLGEDKSFYFRGPDSALNLRAHNLATFLQLADGVDDATWLYHLNRGDYAAWMRDAIKDEDLAAEAYAVQSSGDAQTSRKDIADAIKRRYAAIDSA